VITKTSSDAILIEACRKNKQEAFKILFDRYWEPLFQAASKRLRDANVAKDVVQEIMISLWLKRHLLNADTNGSISAYLFTVLRYRVITYLADISKFEPLEPVRQQVFTLHRDDVPDRLLSNELQSVIEQAIELMPDSMKRTFVLSRRQNCTVKEISSSLSLSEQTVKNLLSQALKRVRSSIEQYYSSTYA
jgi:RNA polymerase sigma-70 factor (ECF subfamily)